MASPGLVIGQELSTVPMDIQIAIATHLTTSDIARMKVVSKAWNKVASILEVQQAAFKYTWGLRSVMHEPQNPNFYLTAGLLHFVVKVTLGPKATLASVLVGFQTDSMTLRMLNNCASDFALQCRPHIYVPVPNKELLHGKHGSFHYDSACRRQFVVLTEADPFSAFSEEVSMPKTVDDLARSKTNYAPSATLLSSNGADLTDRQKELLLKKLTKQLSKGLSIDDGTAAYYLQLTGGNLRDAILMYKEDEQWEQDFPVGMLPLREREPEPAYIPPTPID